MTVKRYAEEWSDDWSAWEHNELNYRDPSAAHEKALRLESKGAKNIVIRPKGHGRYLLTWMEPREKSTRHAKTY